MKREFNVNVYYSEVVQKVQSDICGIEKGKHFPELPICVILNLNTEKGVANYIYQSLNQYSIAIYLVFYHGIHINCIYCSL